MVKLENRYKLENHFVRRRIQVLREKVLLRKFGYLFFRKTITKILPSVAYDFYLKSLLRKTFKKLEMSWYEGRIEWKHNLRAELHHNFVLKKRSFHKFAMFYVAKKTKKVKTSIAEVMFDKNFKKRMLKSIINNWKQFTYRKKTSKLKKAVADQHFKIHFRIERSRLYFTRWVFFARNRRAYKMKLNEAYKYYRMKLISRVFNAFFSYITHRRMRCNQMERVSQFYTDKLKQKMFNKLVSYRMYKLFQRDRMNFASNFYRKKLLRLAMRSFLKHLERQQYKRDRLDLFSKSKVKRMRANYFEYWRIYKNDRKIKQQKLLKASGLHDFKCKKKYFRKLKLNRLNRRRKKKYQAMKMLQVKSIFDRRLLVICFVTWKSYTYNKKIKKEKIHLADVNHESSLKKKYFHIWVSYKIHIKLKRTRLIEIQLFYYQKTLQHCFKEWKIFTDEQRTFKLKKSKSKNYYQSCLIKQIFLLIIKAAFREKDENLNRYLENEKRRLILAQKYLKTWKIKTKNSRKHKTNPVILKKAYSNVGDDMFDKMEQKTIEPQHFLVGSVPESFIWDPACYARPRVPEYMKKYYQDS